MAEIQREEVCVRIKQARKEAGLSQPDMADAIGVALRTYQRYEDDRVPWGKMGEIADVTGVEGGKRWLLHGDQPADEAMVQLREDFRLLREQVEATLRKLNDPDGLDEAGEDVL